MLCDHGELDVGGQRGGHAVDVDLVRVEALRFKEELVALLVGEADDLVFDGRAVARADGLDGAGVHGRAVDVVADELHRCRCGSGDVAADLAERRDLRRAERERRGVGVAGLFGEVCPVDGAAVETGRCAGFEAALAEAEMLEGFAEEDGRGFSRGAAGAGALFAAVDEAVEKGAGGDEDGAGVEAGAVARGGDRCRCAGRSSPRMRRMSATSASSRCRLGIRSSICRMTTRYWALSHWARGDQTAGPREVLSRRNWMPVASATRPMRPPSASISRTRWPLATPPMAGLQLIWAILSSERVRRAVWRPMRAAAAAASQPACPAPTMRMSKVADIAPV